MTKSFSEAISKYLLVCKNESWLYDESDKFLFANHVNNNINWESQSDTEILDILLNSQKIKYTGQRGIKFILKSGQEKAGHFLSLEDIPLLRLAKTQSLENIDWSNRTMSFTGGLSVWLATLFPEQYYPVPMRDINEVIRFLYNPKIAKFPKVGLKYILQCQPFCNETHKLLKKYPIDDLYLRCWNDILPSITGLPITRKDRLDPIDWVWIVQDFHLFVLDQILGRFSKENTTIRPTDFVEPTGVEGNSTLATHMRYERNTSLIKKIKTKAIKENKMLNCEVCGFSFLGTYGHIGHGFIEAHHIKPLSERVGEQVTKSSDIALVCSNCHRMLHREGSISILKLKQIIEKKD